MGDALTLSLPEWLWREKLAPPRALSPLGDALYGAPTRGSTRAWLAWLWVPDDARHRGRGGAALDAVIAQARLDGAARLTAGGPPGNYVRSGVSPDDTAMRALLAQRGFVADAEHVDLTVDARALTGDPRVKRDDDEALVDLVASSFSPGWAHECARARSHGGLFSCRDEHGAVLGVVAHSGNRVDDGTFGPLGVMPAARGLGLGAALARTALADLAARGHEAVTVPWVAPETAAFYRRVAPVIETHPRATWTLTL